jgi:hypothetical protein
MARLSEDVLARGRSFVAAMDLPNVMLWIHLHAPTVDHQLFESTMKKCFAAGDWTRAVRLYDSAFSDYDATAERLGAVLRIGVRLLMILGAVGGCLYLLRACF